MKNRNIKKYYKKRINSGWREYLTLNIPYKLLGIKGDFLTLDKLCNLLNLEYSGEDSGICDEYYMIDKSQMKDGMPKFVSVRLDYNFIDENENINEWLRKREIPENLAYFIDDDKLYYIEGMEGYKNPKFDIDTNPDEPYWLFNEEGSEYGPSGYYITHGNDSENAVECLRLFVNNKKFESDLFSGNFVYGLVSGNHGERLNDGLFKDLSKLSALCKTNYETFFDDYVEVCFAIRYKEYIDPFLKQLKQIIIKHKIKKLL